MLLQKRQSGQAFGIAAEQHLGMQAAPGSAETPASYKRASQDAEVMAQVPGPDHLHEKAGLTQVGFPTLSFSSTLAYSWCEDTRKDIFQMKN